MCVTRSAYLKELIRGEPEFIDFTNVETREETPPESTFGRKHGEQTQCVRVCVRVHALTAPIGKASTAIIQSLRPISFLSCRSCSLLSPPFVSRLDTSIRTHSPKNTAWITCGERETDRTEFSERRRSLTEALTSVKTAQKPSKQADGK